MSRLDNRDLLHTAERAARAGAAALSPFRLQREALRVDIKQTNDFVTAADLASERAVAQIIASDWPTHRILGEELSSGVALGSEPTWVVDPLDGTTNFIHGFPNYCVSVACVVDGEVVAGVVLDPTRDECFAARRGGGAWLGGTQLHVTDAPGLDHTLIGTGFPFRYLDRLESYLGSFRQIAQRAAGIRRPGSAALDLASVAAGRFDGFWEEGLGAWDIAAGTLLIEEAGGLITDFRGGRGFLQDGTVIAGGAAVHRELLEIVARYQLDR
jgi:myo-inositol-1(or 4)-monophosphatase